MVDGVDIDALHTAVAACPDVSGLGSPGLAGLTTYLPGRRIAGLRISPDLLELEVVAAWGASVADIAAQIRSAVSGLVAGRPVNITVADIDVPDQPKNESES